ncbi:hypothetical protein ONQ60_27235, partial [Salmonella enterica subsp. enterica serovar Virginia]|nr:hypothetical protein [Salmonella enterica subsp. enterica serovar Virginia]
QLVETLRDAGRLDSLQLLHFHLGSQMANIRDIATGVRESARFMQRASSASLTGTGWSVSRQAAWISARISSGLIKRSSFGLIRK